MTGKGKSSRAFLIWGMLAILGIGGCGRADETRESSAWPQEKEPYDLAAEEWKAYGEIRDSDQVWSVLGYWDDLATGAAAAGTERTARYTAAEGQNFYILVSDREAGEQGERFFTLTRVDMLTLESERTELQLSDAGGLTAQEETEFSTLREALEQGRAELAGMDVSGGKPCLFFYRWEDKSTAGIYGLQLGEDGKPAKIKDLLPGLERAGRQRENGRPLDFGRDSRGNYYVIDNKEAGKICVLNEEGEFLVWLGSSGRPDDIFFRTGKLPDGSPVFESWNPEAEVLTLLSFDGSGERVLYRGQGTAAQARHIGGGGETVWLDDSGILRWDAAKGSCKRFYPNHGWKVSGCEAIWESEEGEITVACYDGGVTSLSRLGQGVEEKVQLRLFALFGGDEWKEYAAEYGRRHPGMEIQVESGEPGSDIGVLMNRVMAQMLSGKGPDLLIVNRPQLEIFQEKGVLAGLSDLIPEETRAQIFGSVLRQGTIGEELYGIADTVSVSTLLVSEKVWAGESWTAEDVLELLEERERRGEPCDRWISQSGSLTAEQMLFALALLDIGGEDSSLVDPEQGKCFFDTPEFIRLLEACKKYGEAPGERGYPSKEERLAELEGGKALAFPTEGDLKGFSGDMALCGEGYHCVGYPTEGGNGSRVTCYRLAAMSAETEHYELAADFLRELWGVETQRKLATSTVRRDLLTEGVADRHPAFDGAPAFLLGERDVISLGGKADGTSFLQEYMELLEKGKPESWWNTELRGIIQEEAGAFFAGDRSAPDTARILQNRIQNYLDERR